MKRTKFTKTPIVGLLKQHEGGKRTEENIQYKTHRKSGLKPYDPVPETIASLHCIYWYLMSRFRFSR
ncbi:MAG: hypothetical protein KDC59_01705 [Saprospiraceae bacterium]|nr:hypothetical protein [Saprospiraceae bacterium]